MQAVGIFVDPLLTHTYADACAQAVWQTARERAEHLLAGWCQSEDLPTQLEYVPFTPALMERCVVDASVSTAIWRSHHRTGSVRIGPDDVLDAARLLERWLQSRGVAALYRVYVAVAEYDFLQPLVLHKRLRESDFLSGARHYPYLPESLDTHLLLSMALDMVRLRQVRGDRVIQLTRLGVERYREVRDALEASGYFDQRVTLSAVFQFERMEDWDALCAAVWPDVDALRRRYLAWLNVPPDARLLEVGCGAGALTLDTGLATHLERGGHLTAAHASPGMLEQARRKYEAMGRPGHVDLVQAPADDLPFPDGWFDLALGTALIHFADPLRVLSEMRRAVRPGGIVSVFQTVQADLWRPFFVEWFEPVFELIARHRGMDVRDYLPSVDRLTNWFQSVGLCDLEMDVCTLRWVFDDAERVVQHLVRGVRFFQTELAHLPWDDQVTLVRELVDRGRDVCRKFPLAQRTLEMPTVMVRGRRPSVQVRDV